MLTTSKIKTLSLRVDRDRRQIERAALRKIGVIAGKAYRHAGHAVRVGADPVRAARDVIEGNARLSLPGVTPILTRAMVVADLYGRRRTHLDASRTQYDLAAPETEEIRQRERDKELAALLLLLGISGAALSDLYAQYRPQAEAATQRIAGQVTAAIEGSQSAPTRYADTRHSRYRPGVIRRLAGQSETVSHLETPTARVRQIAEGFQSGGLTIENGFALEREVAKAVVTKYEQGRFTGTPATTETLWGYHYSAILDSRTTRVCRALDGTTTPKEDPFWDTFRPPNHWNCRSCVLPVWRSSALPEPSIIQPYATADDIAEFLAIKRQFLSYQ